MLYLRVISGNLWRTVKLCVSIYKNKNNSFTDFNLLRLSFDIDVACLQTSFRHSPSTPTAAFHAVKSLKAKSEKKAPLCGRGEGGEAVFHCFSPMSVCKASKEAKMQDWYFYLEIHFQGKITELNLIRAASTYIQTWEFF